MSVTSSHLSEPGKATLVNGWLLTVNNIPGLTVNSLQGEKQDKRKGVKLQEQSRGGCQVSPEYRITNKGGNPHSAKPRRTASPDDSFPLSFPTGAPSRGLIPPSPQMGRMTPCAWRHWPGGGSPVRWRPLGNNSLEQGCFSSVVVVIKTSSTHLSIRNVSLHNHMRWASCSTAYRGRRII